MMYRLNLNLYIDLLLHTIQYSLDQFIRYNFNLSTTKLFELLVLMCNKCISTQFDNTNQNKEVLFIIRAAFIV